MKVSLLDCTLRDGGYVNDWDFGYNNLISIFERLVSAKVDIIEVGFLDERCQFDINRSIMPDTKAVNSIWGNLFKGGSMIVGMVDYGTCHIRNIQSCDSCFLDGIRVIFKEPQMHEALEYCRQVQSKGYKVFAQMVSVTTYTCDKLKEFADLANKTCPYAVSMVDTYGLLHQDELMRIFYELDRELLPEISLGYHAHNNFQMAYANCIEVLKSNVDRKLLIDGTLYGMGKSAGNAPIELLSMYLNEHMGKSYCISQLLEAIEINIMDIYKKVQWGYNLFYYIAASSKCHPNYVSYLMSKKTLSVKSVVEILDKIPQNDKLTYNLKIIERLYLEYQNCICDEEKAIEMLKVELRNKNVVLLGPGESIRHKKSEIINFIEKNEAIVIAINFVPEFVKIDYLFLSNSKRYMQISAQREQVEKNDIKTIATSNITKIKDDFDYVLNYGNLIEPKEIIPDISFIMFLKILLKLDIPQVSVAGFDGYNENKNNYFHTDMEYDFIKGKAMYINDFTKRYLHDIKGRLEVEFITESKYK
jgi:Isopropylmalate/homocitrate/citramalate synthases